MSDRAALATPERIARPPVPVVAGLEATGITKSYGRGIWPRRRDLPVLRGADVTVGAGEVVGEHFELFGVAYGMGGHAVAAAEGLYDTLGFSRWRTARVEELSGGTRAKLNLAVALIADPEVLLLDEPYAGFDWDTYLRFWDLTAERRAAGRSVLVISHFISDEERFDRLVDLRDGRTVPR